MPSRLRVLHVVGARPNFMKVAPIVKEMARHPEAFEQFVVHTGQHYDAAMSEVFFHELGIPEPDFNLEVGSGTHAQQTAQVMMRFEPALLQRRPDWVLVPGDVNSTLACALVAVKLGFPVAHVEAGLRSFDRGMPEEINRLLTDQISEMLLTPSQDANENLLREGIKASKIHLVGNVMIDTLMELTPKAEVGWDGLRRRLGLDGKFILATLHRPSNVDDSGNLQQVLQALKELAADSPVILPVHPRTRQRIDQMTDRAIHPNLRLTDPLPYLEFLALEKYAALVVTDSGGVQEETTFLGVPCLTIRPNTERPVTIRQGTNMLVACRQREIVRAALGRLSAKPSGRSVPSLWDGKTAGRIVSLLRSRGG